MREISLVDLEKSFNALSSLAVEINSARNAMGAVITEINKRLQTLNIGVACWIEISKTSTKTREIGYSKLNKKWGLNLRNTSGIAPDVEVEMWPFNDSPSWFRVEAVDKIPDLLSEMVGRTIDHIKVLEKKTIQAQEILSSLTEQKCHESNYKEEKR